MVIRSVNYFIFFALAYEAVGQFSPSPDHLPIDSLMVSVLNTGKFT